MKTANSPKTNCTIIDDHASLKHYTNLTEGLRCHKKVQFTSKLDEADNIEWNFKYRGYPLSLHFNIFSGIILTYQINNESKVVTEVRHILEGMRA